MQKCLFDGAGPLSMTWPNWDAKKHVNFLFQSPGSLETTMQLKF
jgi:hypothetical protein